MTTSYLRAVDDLQFCLLQIDVFQIATYETDHRIAVVDSICAEFLVCKGSASRARRKVTVDETTTIVRENESVCLA